MFQSILMMGGLGVAMGAVLVIASKAFYVYEDPKVVAIGEILPGANCGGCGYPGCTANAEAIVQGLSGVNSCVAAGDEVAQQIAAVMGVALTDSEPDFAGPGCSYGNDKADLDYIYKGITDCRAAMMMFGGMKVCRVGCLGLGTCVKACMFGALSIGPDGLPKVDQTKCTGCGACERACPKNIIRLTSVTRRIIREYTVEECTTPCQRACPTGIDIKEYIRLIKEGDYQGALQVIKERNPFPTVISRICPAPCEFNCRRLIQDEAVGINDLKRFVCDYEMNQNIRALPYKAPATDKKVAVIGGGVEGLSAAFFTARLGHAVTVFEATGQFGGILRKAISRERLSMDVLDWDVQGIQEMGVTFDPHKKAGKAFTIDSLLNQEYDAVFTATGGWDSRLARDDIQEAETVFPGAYLLIDVLRSQTNDSIRIESGAHAVIAGGGAALDQAVDVLKAKGAKRVTIISRQPEKEGLDAALAKNLAQKEVTLVYFSGITKVSGHENQLDSIEYTDLATGEKRSLMTDTLVIASGRFPELVFTRTASDPDHSQPENGEEELLWEGVECLKKPDANREIGLLSSQDVISEYTSAVAAINGGRKAAAAIHNRMYGIEYQNNENLITPYSILQNVTSLTDVMSVPRNIPEIKKVKKESQDFSTGFSIETAHKEASRCLQCGLICYEREKTA